MENKEVIYSLVEKHFAVSKEGLQTFKKYLFEPYIDETYRAILKDSLRARFSVENFDASRFDEGWQYFKNYFSRFIRKFNITYQNYFDNKIIVDKNERKLVKFLQDYYLNQIPLRDSFEEMGLYFNSTQDETKRKAILLKFIEDKINVVGAMKLSKGKLQIVFTMDFADWFLCSTGEKWTSCICLDSDYDGNFWSGLPGLVGDKNRAMIYITDGTQKNYHGIKVDKLLARSWVLLSNKDIMQLVRFYPNSLIKTSEINKITGLKFNQEDDNSKGFESKYPIELIKFENGCSAGVFQDSYGLCQDRFLRYGHHGYNHFDAKGKISENRIFGWRHGLKGLIEQGKTLSSAVDDSYRCHGCGYEMQDDEGCEGLDGNNYCEHCFNERYFDCSNCGDTFCNEDAIKNSRGYKYCSDCYEELFYRCSSCGREERYSDNKYNHEDADGSPICEKCYVEKYAKCNSCQKSFGPEANNRVKTKNGNIYCLACAKEKGVKLHGKHE